jgi:uncharacterized protein YdiU (UPF0061 family)
LRAPEAIYSRAQPTSFETAAGLSHCNGAAGELLDLDPAMTAVPMFPTVFSGAQPRPATTRLRYGAGHRFGHYIPQLGNGHAILPDEAARSRPDAGCHVACTAATLNTYCATTWHNPPKHIDASTGLHRNRSAV